MKSPQKTAAEVWVDFLVVRRCDLGLSYSAALNIKILSQSHDERSLKTSTLKKTTLNRHPSPASKQC